MQTKLRPKASANTGAPAQRCRLEDEPRNRLAFMAGKNSARARMPRGRLSIISGWMAG